MAQELVDLAMEGFGELHRPPKTEFERYIVDNSLEEDLDEEINFDQIMSVFLICNFYMQSVRNYR